MSGVPWNSLSKRLQESIESQGPMYPLGLGADPMIPESETDRACGCHERNGAWWLCQYHEGFQDADAIASGYTELLKEQALIELSAQIVSLNAELLALRTALVRWDSNPDRPRVESAEAQRDNIVDYLIDNFRPDRPYPAVDHVIRLITERYSVDDEILYAVIDENHWGLREEQP